MRKSELGEYSMKEPVSLDMNEIIINAIINGENFPLEMNKPEKKKFAKEIALKCQNFSFDRSRDDFKKQISSIIEEAITRHQKVD